MIGKGSLVRVSSPAAGTVLGRVEDLNAPADLPDLPREFCPPGTAAKTRALLVADGCRQVAAISHFHDGDRVIFIALENANGWWDLQGQQLTITEEENHDPKP